MYGKYTLFYESPKNWGYHAHAYTVCTGPLLHGGGGEGPGNEAMLRVSVKRGYTVYLGILKFSSCFHQLKWTDHTYKSNGVTFQLMMRRFNRCEKCILFLDSLLKFKHVSTLAVGVTEACR